MQSKNIYSLPVKKENILGIKKESPTHKGQFKNSIDYRLPEGTPVYAAETGKVIFVKSDSNIGGPKKEFWNEGNAVVIKHKNNEFSRYEHLKHKGVTVKEGQIVKKGAIIGYSGNTGYSTAPHLHFQVFKFTKKNPNPDKDFECLEIRLNKK